MTSFSSRLWQGAAVVATTGAVSSLWYWHVTSAACPNVALESVSHASTLRALLVSAAGQTYAGPPLCGAAFQMEVPTAWMEHYQGRSPNKLDACGLAQQLLLAFRKAASGAGAPSAPLEPGAPLDGPGLRLLGIVSPGHKQPQLPSNMPAPPCALPVVPAHGAHNTASILYYWDVPRDQRLLSRSLPIRGGVHELMVERISERTARVTLVIAGVYDAPSTSWAVTGTHSLQCSYARSLLLGTVSELERANGAHELTRL